MGTKTKAERWSASGTASVVILRPLLRYARTKGIHDAILAAIEVPASVLDDYDYRITEASRARAWTEARARTDDPAMGLHVAAHAWIGAFEVLDYSLYFSSNLREALQHICRFHRVLCDAWAFTWHAESDATRLQRVERTPPVEAEAYFAVLTLRCRELSGVDLAPREIRFVHEAPADTSAHAALFRCPVRFGCATSEILFASEDLAHPVTTANPGVERVLERHMNDLLARLPKNDSFVERVRGVVARRIGRGRLTVGAIAHELHASPRTVQRRLGDHGTTYGQVLDAYRRELAQRLIAEQRMSVTEIAFLLGFADVSGFARMYKRWTGVTPSQARPLSVARGHGSLRASP